MTWGYFWAARRQNKREVKTKSSSPPGVGGVLHDAALGGSAGLPCQAGLQPHSRIAFGQFVRRLTTKELVLERFVAPQNAHVNCKNLSILYRDCDAAPLAFNPNFEAGKGSLSPPGAQKPGLGLRR